MEVMRNRNSLKLINEVNHRVKAIETTGKNKTGKISNFIRKRFTGICTGHCTGSKLLKEYLHNVNVLIN